jgi:hypothetical protein
VLLAVDVGFGVLMGPLCSRSGDVDGWANFRKGLKEMDRASCSVGDAMCVEVEARNTDVLCAGRRLSSSLRPSVVAILM